MTLLAPRHSRLWKYWAAHFLWVEFGIAALAGAAFGIWANSFDGWSVIAATIGSGWSTLFSTLVTLFGALFGFAITAASIAVALVTDEKLRRLVLGKHYLDLWDTFLQTIGTLGFALTTAMVGLILSENGHTHVPILCVLFFLAVLAALRLTRTVWLLDLLPRLHAALVKKESGG
jgi:hypothetical protein